MPETIFRQLIRRAGLFSENTVAYHCERLKSFRSSVRVSDFAELISLPDPQLLLSGQIKVALPEML